jgi:hypothetical protein
MLAGHQHTGLAEEWFHQYLSTEEGNPHTQCSSTSAMPGLHTHLWSQTPDCAVFAACANATYTPQVKDRKWCEEQCLSSEHLPYDSASSQPLYSFDWHHER